jgi:hypothetical protein
MQVYTASLAAPTALCFILTGCVAISTLPPEEVLDRAAKKSQEITEFSFRGDAQIESESPSTTLWDVSVTGRIRESGDQMALSISLIGDDTEPEGDTEDYVSAGEMIIAGPSDMYVKISSLGLPSNTLILEDAIVEMIVGTWWALPRENSRSVISPVTPDPQLLSLQSEILTFKEDKGLSRLDSGWTYHYAVEADPKKLREFLSTQPQSQKKQFDREEATDFVNDVQAEGELWIDQSSFLIHRVKWDMFFESKNMRIMLDISLSDHGSVSLIYPPDDAVELNAKSLFTKNSALELEKDIQKKIMDAIFKGSE